ncbi:DUF3796 domain-containing protein [Microbacteriaceae bacterium 4G12]
MKTTWVKYIGFFGFFGLLGFYNHVLFNMFWLFFAFANYRKVRHDEMFERAVNLACRNAFVITLLFLFIVLPIEILFPNHTMKELDIAIIFGTMLLTFQFSLYYYDRSIEEEV